MNKQEIKEMLDRIYEEISNKELSSGCKVLLNCFGWIERYEVECDVYKNYKLDSNNSLGFIIGDEICYKSIEDIIKIKGHPIMIGDCLDWILKDSCLGAKEFDILDIVEAWKNKRLPIDQEEDAIVLMFNLINK